MKDVLIVFRLLTSYRLLQWPEEIKIAGRYIWPTLRESEALLSPFPRGVQLLRNAGHDKGSV